MTMEHIYFGVIGTGTMASTMMEAFEGLANVTVLAVHSNSTQRAQEFSQFHKIPRYYSNLDEILNHEKIEALYIANSTEKHSETSIKALNAGKSVLCEKPCAISSDEFKRIKQAADTSGKLFMEGFWTLLLPTYQKLLHYNFENHFGQAKHLTASFGYPVSELTYPELFKSPAGGVLSDRGVYLIALSLRLLGDVKKATASFGMNSEEVDTDISILLNHGSGGCSQLTASLTLLLSNDITLGCENGSIHIPSPALGAEFLTTQLIVKPVGGKVDFLSYGSRQKITRKLKSLGILRRLKNIGARNSGEYLSFGKNQYIPQLEHFCDLLRSKRVESDQVSHELSLKVVEIVEQLKEVRR